MFLRSPDGRVTQLTDPWIEDWRDGLAAGDLRSNTQPRMSADGRYVVVTNTSTMTGESFLLRIDLSYRLGAQPHQRHRRRAAHRRRRACLLRRRGRLAFTWTYGGDRGIYTMDADSGERVVSWSPPGPAPARPPTRRTDRFLAYVTQRGKGTAIVRTTLDKAGRASGTGWSARARRSLVAAGLARRGRDRLLSLARGRAGLFIADASGRASARARCSPTLSAASSRWTGGEPG